MFMGVDDRLRSRPAARLPCSNILTKKSGVFFPGVGRPHSSSGSTVFPHRVHALCHAVSRCWTFACCTPRWTGFDSPLRKKIKEIVNTLLVPFVPWSRYRRTIFFIKISPYGFLNVVHTNTFFMRESNSQQVAQKIIAYPYSNRTVNIEFR